MSQHGTFLCNQYHNVFIKRNGYTNAEWNHICSITVVSPFHGVNALCVPYYFMIQNTNMRVSYQYWSRDCALNARQLLEGENARIGSRQLTRKFFRNSRRTTKAFVDLVLSTQQYLKDPTTDFSTMRSIFLLSLGGLLSPAHFTTLSIVKNCDKAA